MRRVALLLTVMGAALLLASGVVLSEPITGTNGDDILHGSPERDTIAGGNGDDQLYGHKEKDRLYGDSGADWLDGGNGNDKLFGGLGKDSLIGGTASNNFLNAIDGRRDSVINCGGAGAGQGVAYVDANEVDIASHCAVFVAEPESLQAQGVAPGTLTPETALAKGVSLEEVSP